MNQAAGAELQLHAGVTYPVELVADISNIGPGCTTTDVISGAVTVQYAGLTP